MFAGNAAGVYLPPMVVYKVASENVYDSWMEGGPRGALYASTKSVVQHRHVRKVVFRNIFAARATFNRSESSNR